MPWSGSPEMMGRMEGLRRGLRRSGRTTHGIAYQGHSNEETRACTPSASHVEVQGCR